VAWVSASHAVQIEFWGNRLAFLGIRRLWPGDLGALASVTSGFGLAGAWEQWALAAAGSFHRTDPGFLKPLPDWPLGITGHTNFSSGRSVGLGAQRRQATGSAPRMEEH